ncbi:hypothetical protein BH10CYA1_BH10CYA1_04140 [soil metagenome]
MSEELKTAKDRHIVLSRGLGIFAIAALLSSLSRPVSGAESSGADSRRNASRGILWRTNLSEREATAIGTKIWRNECGGRIDGLTSWNAGEDFPSLGIGHFIWYPKNAHDKFEESFPRLVAFLQSKGVKLPSWLKADMRCPWNSRQRFLSDARGKEMTELRTMLTRTVPEQTEFIVQRLEGALPKVLENVPEESRIAIRSRFNRVMASGSAGKFALIDYVNFKGEGVNPGERYNEQGWGLLQVLEGMHDQGDAVQSFIKSADSALTLRVKNAPPERHEGKWLLGWKRRVAKYSSGTTGSSRTVLGTTAPKSSNVPKPPIVTREEWGSKAQPIGENRKQVPDWITLHHAGELWHEKDDPIEFVRHMQVWGQKRPQLEKTPRDTYWPDLPYHFLIAPDGRIFEGRPTQYEPESNTKYPLHGNIGVEMMGDFNVQRPTLEEIRSCVKLTAWLCQQYHISLDHVRTHQDAAPKQTDCPGKDFYRYIVDGQFKRWLQETMQGKEPSIDLGPSSL